MNIDDAWELQGEPEPDDMYTDAASLRADELQAYITADTAEDTSIRYYWYASSINDAAEQHRLMSGSYPGVVVLAPVQLG